MGWQVLNYKMLKTRKISFHFGNGENLSFETFSQLLKNNLPTIKIKNSKPKYSQNNYMHHHWSWEGVLYFHFVGIVFNKILIYTSDGTHGRCWRSRINTVFVENYYDEKIIRWSSKLIDNCRMVLLKRFLKMYFRSFPLNLLFLNC